MPQFDNPSDSAMEFFFYLIFAFVYSYVMARRKRKYIFFTASDLWNSSLKGKGGESVERGQNQMDFYSVSIAEELFDFDFSCSEDDGA